MCGGGGAERWLDRVKEEEGVGSVLMYIRWISNSSEDLPAVCDVRIHKEEFADDVVLLASTREAAGIAVRVYMEVDKSFGLTLSIVRRSGSWWLDMVLMKGICYHLTSLVAVLTGLVSSPILGTS